MPINTALDLAIFLEQLPAVETANGMLHSVAVHALNAFAAATNFASLKHQPANVDVNESLPPRDLVSKLLDLTTALNLSAMGAKFARDVDDAVPELPGTCAYQMVLDVFEGSKVKSVVIPEMFAFSTTTATPEEVLSMLKVLKCMSNTATF